MRIGGDFNFSLSPLLDRSLPQTTHSKNARAVANIIKEFDLLDVWRHLNPVSKSYTFHSMAHSSSSRIDFIFVSRCLTDLIEFSDVGHIALSDHAPVTMLMQPLRPIEWSFSWRIDALLFLDNNFVKFLEEQTDFFLKCNDNKEVDTRPAVCGMHIKLI